jgi:hypothetical protein
MVNIKGVGKARFFGSVTIMQRNKADIAVNELQEFSQFELFFP